MHQKKELQVKRTAHYYLQHPTKEIKSILYVIHGYAQLAVDFIKNFESLEQHHFLVVAPEGLSKFYGKERLPVAAWMTKHERNAEISNYLDYLQKLHHEIRDEYGAKPILILGFSQGVSTAFRWLAAFNEPVSLALACSGSIPPELSEVNFKNQSKLKVNFYYGNDDGLLKPENAAEQLVQLKKLKLAVNYRPFEGRHEISANCIKDLIDFQKNLN